MLTRAVNTNVTGLEVTSWEHVLFTLAGQTWEQKKSTSAGGVGGRSENFPRGSLK